MNIIKEFNEFDKPIKLTQDELFEMANLRSTSTGLPMTIYVSEKQASHGARIKVSQNYNKMNTSDLFSVSILPTPSIVAGDKGSISNSDLSKVYKWIKINQITLMDYWDRKIDTAELIGLLKKI